MHVLGVLGDDLLAETAERVLHHLVVTVEVARPGCGGERCEQRRFAVVGDERFVFRQLRHVHRPHRFAAEQSRREVVHHVGDERTRNLGFSFAFRAVVEQRARSLERRTRVGDVVGEHLLTLRPAALGELLRGAPQQLRDAVDDRRSSSEVFLWIAHGVQR